MLGSAVHIWYRLTDAISDADVAALASRLPADERNRAASFVFARDRRDYVAAHALLRDTLSFYEPPPPAGWAFESGEYGKPHLPSIHAGAPPLTFNLSHTRGLVACAVARDCDVGLDVEPIDAGADRLDIARQYFSPTEISQLDACANDAKAARFIDLWTLKEAYVKATGAGLTDGLNQWGFRFDGDRQIHFEGPASAKAEDWTFALFAPSPTMRMALAVRSRRPERLHLTARVAGLGPLDASLRAETLPVLRESQPRR